MEWTFENIMYLVAIVSYGLFIFRLILLWTVGDIDFDIGLDGDLGDIISFKGLNHFLMGFSGWISYRFLDHSTPTTVDYALAVIFGVIFMALLYFIYKFIYSLNTEPDIATGADLCGRTGMIMYHTADINDSAVHKYIVSVNNNVGSVNVDAVSTNKYDAGDEVTLLDFGNLTFPELGNFVFNNTYKI